MKRIIAVILCFVLCVLLLSGCIKESESMFTDDGRMVVVEIINDYEYIVEDPETGILYYMVRTTYGVGITPLLDKNGNVQSSKKYR